MDMHSPAGTGPSRAALVLMLILYNCVLLLITPLAILYIIWGLIITDRSRRGMLERLGFARVRDLPAGPRLWLHAVSVGETAAAKPIWQAILAVLPGWTFIHSVTTDTGHQQAMKFVGEAGRLIYFPFDFLPCVWLALARVRPRLIVLVETELWPNYLALARLLGCKILLVNGRISDRSLRGGARIGPVYRWMTSMIDRFCMQSTEDAERIIRLGADPARVTVVGNSKFEHVLAPVPLGEQITLRNTLGLRREEIVLLAGCTHPGEEEVVLRAFRQVKTTFPDMRLVIAPRDINRAQEIEELAGAHGFVAARRTRLATQAPPPDAVLILDTIGELARAYAICAVAFVGGSLAPLGGHNVLEPLAMGKAALFGPHMSNFRDIAVIVEAAGVGFMVHDAPELAAQWQRLLADPRARQAIADKSASVFQQHRGASAHCAAEAAWLVTGKAPSGSPAVRIEE